MNKFVCVEMNRRIVSPTDKVYTSKGLSNNFQTAPCLYILGGCLRCGGLRAFA